jgi:hypothetical protein
MLFLKGHFFAFAGALGGFALGSAVPVIGVITGPAGALVGGAIGYVIDSIGATQAAGTTLQAGASVGSQAATLAQAATVAPEAPGLGLFGPAGGAIWVPGAAGILSLFSTAVIIGSMFVPPGKEVGGGIDFYAPDIIAEDYDYSQCAGQPACELAEIFQKCTSGIVSKQTWSQIKTCLDGTKYQEGTAVYKELYHSVWELENNSNLQCVGFKIAAEKGLGITLPPQNALAFLKGDDPGTPDEGMLAIWGPRDECIDADGQKITDVGKAKQLCEKNILCCGHIGNVTKVADGLAYITSAWGDSGLVNTIKVPIGKRKGGAPWQYRKP